MKTKVFTKNQREYTKIGESQLIENIKILLYKFDEDIFDLLDFENHQIYKEPLLFAFFNAKNQTKAMLHAVIYGYIRPELRPEQLDIQTDSTGKIYLPNLCWIHTEYREQQVLLIKEKNNTFSLSMNGKKIAFHTEPLSMIEGTTVELLPYSIPLLKQVYYDVDDNLIEVEIENITKKQSNHIALAWKLIKELVPNQYELITSVTSKTVIFNVDTTLRNSFASMSAQGIAFFNACQEEYNEVFFVDDIAHQTGYVIFNALTYEVTDFIKIDPTTVVERIKLGNDTEETRPIHIVFHALYTYYTTFICLDACLDAEVFVEEKKHEALGRMIFYISKCYHDLLLIDNPIASSAGSKEIFTEKGLAIYQEIKNTFNKMGKKWHLVANNFDLSNQPYNFSFSKFIKLNPL